MPDRSQYRRLDVFDKVPIGILAVDAEWRVVFWNQCLENWTGIARSGILDCDVRERFPRMALPAVAGRIGRVFRSGIPTVFSSQLHAPLIPCEISPGVERVENITVTAIPRDGASDFLAVFSIQDITDLTRRLDESRLAASELSRALENRVKLEDDLQRAKEAADRGSRAKSEFLANMSHEIRTPLNGILGVTQLAAACATSENQREYLRIAQDSAETLLAIINDILDLSKIEAGRMELESEPFHIRTELERAVNLMRPAATAKGLTLGMTVEDDVPEKVAGDALRLRQVLVNLVGNAVKFTQTGRVSVSAAPHSPGMCKFSVTDTGIGICPEDQAAIFAPFQQADGSTTRRFGGTGLGLSISKKLVGLMGGEIGVASSPQGSTFWFTACFEPVEAPTSQPPAGGSEATAPGEPLKILLAEDNRVNQFVAVHLLESHGHTVCTAEDGRAAVDAAEAATFDVILMDIQMPRMDGLEATAAIRQRERLTGPRVPIIALTAHAMDGDRQRFLAAGMDGYVSKPIRVPELLAAIAQVRSVRKEAASEDRGATCTPGLLRLVEQLAASSQNATEPDTSEQRDLRIA
jgi:signal transduction histidine kinase/CheY-like chemotaxis protein